MSTFDHLSKTIESFYSAAAGEMEWARSLKHFATILGGVAATLELVDKQKNQSILFQCTGIDPANADKYTDHFQKVASRVQHIMRAGSPEICFDYQSMSENEMDSDEFYADFLAPENMRYYISGRLIQTDDRFGLFSIQRNPSQGHVGDQEIEIVKQTLPHIRRALKLSLRLSESMLYANQLEDALDLHSDGVVLIANDGSLVQANSAARTVFRRNNGIGVREGRLDFADRSAKKHFDNVLQAIANTDIGTPWPETEFLAAQIYDGAPYALSVYPNHGLIDGGKSRYLAIVFIRDLDRQHRLSRQRLQNFLGLTQAESKLAVWVGQGRSLDAYARHRDISINTVYAHFRHLKEKAGCNTQMALVAKIRQIAS